MARPSNPTAILQAVRAWDTHSLDRPLAKGPHNGTLEDLVCISSPDPVGEQVERDSRAAELYAHLDRLDNRERYILSRLFYLDPDRQGLVSLRSLGSELNITCERVRQIKLGALAKLRLWYGAPEVSQSTAYFSDRVLAVLRRRGFWRPWDREAEPGWWTIRGLTCELQDVPFRNHEHKTAVARVHVSHAIWSLKRAGWIEQRWLGYEEHLRYLFLAQLRWMNSRISCFRPIA